MSIKRTHTARVCELCAWFAVTAAAYGIGRATESSAKEPAMESRTVPLVASVPVKVAFAAAFPAGRRRRGLSSHNLSDSAAGHEISF